MAPATTRPRAESASTRTTLVWNPVPDADAYRVELYRGRTRIYVSHARAPRVTLPASWRHDGVRVHVQPEDQAYVRAIVDGRPAARPIVDGALALELTPVGRFSG